MTTPEPTCRHIVFEALFLHGLQADEALLASLKQAGFDHKAPAPEYSHTVLGQCLAVACDTRLNGAHTPESYRTLGNYFVRGITSTMLGKIVATAILLSGPERTIKRIPSLMQSDYGVQVAAEHVGPQHYAMRAKGPLAPWVAPLFQGIFEEALRRTRATPSSTLNGGTEPGAFALDLHWTT